MNKELVFIVSSLSDSHCKNRILDYIRHGYTVHVYGFARDNQLAPTDLPYSITIVGTILSSNYRARIRAYTKGISQIITEQGRKKCYYVFGLDLALFLTMLSPHTPFIYEEADLVHTYMGSIQKIIMECIDKCIIRHSVQTILTSEGFVQYHFGNKCPNNVIIIPNKLNPQILQFPFTKTPTDLQHLRFAFVGGARFDSVDFFIETLLQHFPQHEFHFYGTVESRMERFKDQYPNVFYHGRFKNPDDLPAIYANIDLVLATYDTRCDNVRYAEPNKLYEAIYFHTPIIVSQNTFLAQKVQRLGIGFSIPSMDADAIIDFVRNLTQDQLQQAQQACNLIPQENVIQDIL